jgi:hypothetical protein
VAPLSLGAAIAPDETDVLQSCGATSLTAAPRSTLTLWKKLSRARTRTGMGR